MVMMPMTDMTNFGFPGVGGGVWAPHLVLLAVVGVVVVVVVGVAPGQPLAAAAAHHGLVLAAGAGAEHRQQLTRGPATRAASLERVLRSLGRAAGVAITDVLYNNQMVHLQNHLHRHE